MKKEKPVKPGMPDLITAEQSKIMRGLALIEKGSKMIREAGA